ncbi:F0F1 ATP synthase subunit B [Caloranaerobacter sp. DY30410]|uniref:F0F1 ATP synthase subunit B n=1 Tax=Caloranaerobacter sp. DY30410 TaxID=3238305 RepID=UPI003D032DA5
MSIDVRVIPELSSLVMQIIATIVLFLVLRHFLFKPVTEFLNARKEKIASDLLAANKNKEEAQNLKREYEMKIEASKKEAQEIIEAARRRGEEVREEIIKEAKKEAEAIIEKARKEIEREREKAVEELKEEVVTIAMLAASKVIDKNLDAKAHKEIINKFINEVGEAKWQN